MTHFNTLHVTVLLSIAILAILAILHFNTLHVTVLPKPRLLARFIKFHFNTLHVTVLPVWVSPKYTQSRF